MQWIHFQKKKHETLLKQSQYLQTDEWAEDMNFIYRYSEIKEMAKQFCAVCEDLHRIQKLGKTVPAHIQKRFSSCVSSGLFCIFWSVYLVLKSLLIPFVGSVYI
jgi:hypothetical protein